jgi:hypothetical protein
MGSAAMDPIIPSYSWDSDEEINKTQQHSDRIAATMYSLGI